MHCPRLLCGWILSSSANAGDRVAQVLDVWELLVLEPLLLGLGELRDHALDSADGAVQLRIPELLGVRVVLGRHVHLVELVKPLRATLERLLDLALRLNLLEDFGPAGFALGLHRATGNN